MLYRPGLELSNCHYVLNAELKLIKQSQSHRLFRRNPVTSLSRSAQCMPRFCKRIKFECCCILQLYGTKKINFLPKLLIAARIIFLVSLVKKCMK